MEGQFVWLPLLFFNEPRIYIIPIRFKMMRMTAITSSMWIKLPVCGKLGLMLRPKKPSSHSTNRTMTIVHNMRFLLLNDLWVATWSVDRVAAHRSFRRNLMLWTIVVVLVVLWLLGFFGRSISPSFPQTGNVIHVLLVIAVILVVLNLLGVVRF